MFGYKCVRSLAKLLLHFLLWLFTAFACCHRVAVAPLTARSSGHSETNYVDTKQRWKKWIKTQEEFIIYS